MPGEAVSVVKRQVAAFLAAGSALVVALFTTSLVLAVRTLIITMPEGGQAPPWIWIDGPIFLVMGLAVVPAIIGGARGALARIGTLAGGPGLHGADAFYVPLNVAAILAGIAAGVITFLNVSR